MTVSETGSSSTFWTRTWRRRSLLRGTTAGAGALTLAACGVKTKPTPTSSGSQSTAVRPRTGGTLNVGLIIEPYSWDPTYAGVGSGAAYHLVYNTILSYKHGPGVGYTDMLVQPELASSWEVPDAQTFVFHLRKGVSFASLPPVNGRSMTAADVKFSLEYASRSGAVAAQKLPASVLGSYFEGINTVEAPDDSTVKVTFKSPFVPFVNYIAAPYVPVLAHEVYERDGHFKDTAVGTGPFQLDTASSQKGSRWVFKRNAGYWNSGRLYIDQVNFVVTKDDAAGQAAFQTKQLDLLNTGLDLTSFNALSKANPAAVRYETLDASPVHIYMSVKQGSPLADARLRQAIGLAISHDDFLQSLFQGKGGWAMAGAFPDTFTQDEVHGLLKHDPAQAKQLVTAAGYPSGVDLEFIYPGDYFGQIYVTQIQLLQAQLKQVGINLRFTSMAYDAYSTLKKKHGFTITDSPKSIQGDIDSYLNNTFNPGSVEDYTEVNDPPLTSLLLAQRQEADTNKRREICRQAATRINVDQVWAQALYYPLYWNLWQPRLQNYAPHFGLTLSLDDAWLTD